EKINLHIHRIQKWGSNLKFLASYFIKRIPREGFKSMTIPFLAFALVVLINLLGGIQARQQAEFDDIMDNYEIVAVVSDLSGAYTDNLFITSDYLDLFTSHQIFSLQRQTGDMFLKRRLMISFLDQAPVDGTIMGITHLRSDADYINENGLEFTFFPGYDESIFLTDGLYCVVDENLYAEIGGAFFVEFRSKLKTYDGDGSFVLKNDGSLQQNRDGYTITYWPSYDENGNAVYYFYEPMIDENGELIYITTAVRPIDSKPVSETFTVVGTFFGADETLMYIPYKTANRLGSLSDGQQHYSDSLTVTIADNRDLSAFKLNAWRSFSRVRPIYDSRPFAMMVYDSQFYEMLEPLRLNIAIIDAAAPFVYAMAVCTGFAASILLTRRRKPEFALLRSVGVGRMRIIVGTLIEQAVCCGVGAALGCLFVAATWGYFSLRQPAVFIACYVAGVFFAVLRAAGTDVLKILREGE
ncbi:MAG: hypothetical protein FWE82_09245, partial [Defluviitaleaceae bacterium]|nr:hypothetical protein [Defluviitaleaceae bacterium]